LRYVLEETFGAQLFLTAGLSKTWEGTLKKRSTLRKLLALSVLAAIPPVAFAAGELRAGTDYVRLATPVPQTGKGIEVVEFFSYGCPHCYEAEPKVSKWKATLPQDVTVRRVPISFGRSSWEALAKLYLTLEQTGDLAKLDREVFAALHDQKLPLANDKAVIDWAEKRVADPKKFRDTYGSFGIQTAARNADQSGAKFGIVGVPSFGVAGRYLVVAKDAKSFEDILRTTDRVVALARQAR
jgi:protein dithiol oxidoreductase (disulfide-forming)